MAGKLRSLASTHDNAPTGSGRCRFCREEALPQQPACEPGALVHEGGVDLHEFCTRTHAGTQMISGLDPADRKQSHVGPAEPAQLFDLLAGLSLPPGSCQAR